MYNYLPQAMHRGGHLLRIWSAGDRGLEYKIRITALELPVQRTVWKHLSQNGFRITAFLTPRK